MCAELNGWYAGIIPRKGGETAGGWSEIDQSRTAADGNAAGHEAHTGMMILALTMSHIVGRPATEIGGGTKNPMERPTSRRLISALFYRESESTKTHRVAKFVECKCVSP